MSNKMDSYHDKLELILALCDEVTKNWSDEVKKEFLLQQIFNELSLLRQFKDHKNASKLANLSRIKSTVDSKEKVFHIVVPLERELNDGNKNTEFSVTAKDKTQKKPPHHIVLVLENLRSAFNVGSILRTSEFYNIEKVYLAGYTPTPDNIKVKKTTMGTEDHIQWTKKDNIHQIIEDLKLLNYKLIAIETSMNAVELNHLNVNQPMAFFLGHERFGLSKDVLSKMDQLVCITSYGLKNSLNVSVCAGVVLDKAIELCQKK